MYVYVFMYVNIFLNKVGKNGCKLFTRCWRGIREIMEVTVNMCDPKDQVSFMTRILQKIVNINFFEYDFKNHSDSSINLFGFSGAVSLERKIYYQCNRYLHLSTDHKNHLSLPQSGL